MCKRILTLITIIALILSICSCSILESIIPGGDGQGGNSQTPGGDNPGGEETPGGDNPGGEETPGGDNPGGEETPGGDNPGGDEDKPICENGCKDTDGDVICDNCGHGMVVPPEHLTPTVFLAGDSTVKTYEDGQYIGGWGQFLSLFLGEEIVVKNAAHGGRSSRSFINEGRLYDIDGSSFSFSQNGGNSIADEIKAGDYLFIQFGHNDDDTKASSYSTMYDRMVPLGTPDANGIYPVTPAEKRPTTYLPTAYTDKATDQEEKTALSTIAQYGDEYYAYGDGTYKWYLKQYIDFARSVGAIPVLVTPVARVKFSGDKIIGGEGLHGKNFAYVEAVRQLAAEEDCLLIDLFQESKTILETATPTYANYLMALKPNDLTGSWPSGYDSAYGNTDAGYTGIEATHYNKYGAFLQAAAVAEAVLENPTDYSFYWCVSTTPEAYIDPSNLIGKNTVAKLEALFTSVSVTNPDRSYASAEAVVGTIAALPAPDSVTVENYEQVAELCAAARAEYSALNVDDRPLVTNISLLEALEARVREAELEARPTPTRVVIFNADELQGTLYESTVTEGEFTLVATADKAMEKKGKVVNFKYNGTTYSCDNGLSLGGKASFGSNRYLSFEVDGPCSITIACQSSGSSVRTLNIVDSAKTVVGSYEAGTSISVSTVDITEAGAYSVGSAGSGIYIFMIIIEYFE